MTNYLITNITSLEQPDVLMQDIGEICGIASSDSEKGRYNYSQPPKGNDTAALRKLTQYRRYRHKKEIIEERIELMTKLLSKLDDDRTEPFVHRGKTLPQLWVELAEVGLRLREAEELASRLPKLYYNIAYSRYFDSLKKRPPEWSVTVREFGLPITAAELRSRFCHALSQCVK